MILRRMTKYWRFRPLILFTKKMPNLRHSLITENPQRKQVFTPANGLDLRGREDLTPVRRRENLLFAGEGRWQKRKGIKKVLDLGETAPKITLFKKFGSKFAVCYGKKGGLWDGVTADTVAAFTGLPAGAGTEFTTNAPFSGEKYGTRFFLCNGGDKIGSVNSSGAFTLIGDAPKAKIIRFAGKRLLAGNTDTHEAELHASKEDDGNGDFAAAEDWTVGDSLTGSPYRNLFASMGALNAIGTIGDRIVCLHDDGRYGFHIEKLDIGGTGLSQVALTDFENLDFGGQRGAKSTKHGIFYANRYGVWRLGGGRDQETYEKNATAALGEEYMARLDFSDADIAYQPITERILVTCKKDSDYNNHVIVIDLSEGSVSEITGWCIGRFEQAGETLYGVSSRDAVVYELFTGYSDDGTAIGAVYESGDEVFGDIDREKKARFLSVQGRLALSTTVNIAGGMTDKKGQELEKVINRFWSLGKLSDGNAGGIGEQGIGRAIAGGQESDLVDSYFAEQVKTKAFQALRLKITETSESPFEFHFASVTASLGRRLKRKGLTS